METRKKLEEALHVAMRSNDQVRKQTIRMALASIKMAEVEHRGTPLDETAVLTLLQKEIKSRRESINDAQKAGRQDLIESLELEIAVLEEFLPKGLTDDELRALVTEVVAEVNASSPADMGKLMKALMPRIAGRAAGDRVNQMVRQVLQG